MCLCPRLIEASKTLTAKPQILFRIPHVPQRQAMQDVITRRSRDIDAMALLSLTESALPRSFLVL